MDRELKYMIFRSDDQHKLESEVQQFIKDKEVKDIIWSYNEMTNEYVAIVYYLISNA